MDREKLLYRMPVKFLKILFWILSEQFFYVSVYETACYQLPPVSIKSNWSTSEGWDRTTDMGIDGRLFAFATTILDNGLVNDYIW